MKRMLATVLCILFHFLTHAQSQQHKDHVMVDLSASGGRLCRTVTVKDQGVLLDICNTKTASYDLVYYDKNMNKKWTFTLSKTDLDISNRSQMENNSQDELFYADGKFIYVHIKWGNSMVGMRPKSYCDFCIDINGKLIVKNETPFEDKSSYRGIIADKENAYLFCDNGQTGEKQSYYLMAMNPKTGVFNKKTILPVPTLKSGEWSYAGYAEGQLYFFGVEDQSNAETKNNGLTLAFAPVTVNGEKCKPFELNVKLDKYYASNEDVGAPLARVLIDTITKAIYVYCHMTETKINTENNMHKCKGIYIKKFDLEGRPVWSKQYNNEDLEKYNPSASKSGIVSIYNSHITIDDSTKDIILVREGGGVSIHDTKCFDLDENGNIKKIVVGTDQSSKFMNKADASPFYSNVEYSQGDDSYFKSLQTIFSKYPTGQSRPAAYVFHLGDVYWACVMDATKFTMDIYKL